MTYALVTDSTIQSLGGLPRSARRLDTGDWVLGLRDAPVALQEACGYFEVTETPRPAPSGPGVVVESTVELVAGTPTQVWTERPMTADEQTAATEQANRSTIETNLANDLAAMQTTIDTTNATINSSPASHIKAQARALRRLVKHALNDYTTAE